jgi:hypothetical protein
MTRLNHGPTACDPYGQDAQGSSPRPDGPRVSKGELTEG